MRKVIVAAAAMLCGLIILADFVVRLPWLHILAARLLEGGLILVCFALLLGILNLLAYHLQRIGSHSASKWQSWVIISALFVCLVLSLMPAASGLVSWVYHYLITPLMATMGALLVFYGVFAAPRLLVVRNAAGILLFVSFMVFMFLWIPYISSLSPWIAAIRVWLFTVPLGTGMRGILLGTAIGASAAALRLIFAIDKPFSTSAEKH